MKRYLTFILALVIAITSLTTVSFAASNTDLELGLMVKNLKQEIIEDESFEVTLYANKDDILAVTYQIGIDFDPEYFEVEKVESAVKSSIAGIEIIDNDEGKFDFAYFIDSVKLKENDNDDKYKLATITFNTLKNVTEELEIKIDEARTILLDLDSEEVDFEVENLEITIPEPPEKSKPSSNYYYAGDKLEVYSDTDDVEFYYSTQKDEYPDIRATGGSISLPKTSKKSVTYYLIARKYGIDSDITEIELKFRNTGGGGGGGGSVSGTTSGNTNTKPSTTTPSTTTPSTSTTITTPVINEKYADIKGHWAENDIKKLIDKKIISGYEDGTVKPANPVTRAEIAKIIVCALGQKEAAVNLEFKDNGAIADWAAGYIQAAVNLGILNGYDDGTFKPSQPVTRQELAKIAMLAFKYGESEKELTFNDNAKIPEWSAKYIAAAVENGIINGYEDGSFLPANNVTRAEACAIISRCLK